MGESSLLAFRAIIYIKNSCYFFLVWNLVVWNWSFAFYRQPFSYAVGLSNDSKYNSLVLFQNVCILPSNLDLQGSEILVEDFFHSVPWLYHSSSLLLVWFQLRAVRRFYSFPLVFEVLLLLILSYLDSFWFLMFWLWYALVLLCLSCILLGSLWTSWVSAEVSIQRVCLLFSHFPFFLVVLQFRDYLACSNPLNTFSFLPFFYIFFLWTFHSYC